MGLAHWNPDGSYSAFCPGCGFNFNEKGFKPIYDDETWLMNGKDPKKLRGLCGECQDKKAKSGRADF